MPAMLAAAITALRQGCHLAEVEAQGVITALMGGQVAEREVETLLTAWRDAGVTVDELTGAARAMRAAATSITLSPGVVVDTCGTGGDGLGTFNISTVAALIVAGAGVRVAKHGNRGATSACGSADLLAALGVTVDVGPAIVVRCVEEAGFGFLFAPRFHPAMRHVAAVRKRLGFRTIFNLLGPLTNPAGVTQQVVGVSDPNLVDLMAQALSRLGSRRALVVHGEDGADEISTTAPTQVVELAEGKTVSYTITPEAFGLSRATLAQLRGGAPAACARIARDVLEGRPGPARDAALLNAAGALYVAGAAADLANGLAVARQAVDSHRAWSLLQRLKELTNAS